MAVQCAKIPFCENFVGKRTGGTADQSTVILKCVYPGCSISEAYKVLEKNISKVTGLSDCERGKKDDSDKLRFDLIPPILLKAVATILTFGAKKYSPNNWQRLGNFNERFTGALMRHLNAWRDGEKIDQESGQPHLWHIACNVAFLIWKEYNTNETT